MIEAAASLAQNSPGPMPSTAVASRSIECANLIRRTAKTQDDDEVVQLSESYRGRFALDFAYEPWSASYRDSMHAAYLGVIESAVARHIGAGENLRALRLARRAVEVDPEAEELELSLLRVYRNLGAAAAAAEQYEHYAAVVRETLGVDPPALHEL